MSAETSVSGMLVVRLGSDRYIKVNTPISGLHGCAICSFKNRSMFSYIPCIEYCLNIPVRSGKSASFTKLSLYTSRYVLKYEHDKKYSNRR